jgi:AcrR family transcriptional regulator
MGGYYMNRNERRKKETREKILTAGRRVFKEYGYSGASIAKVMEYADLGHGTFYQHFKNKDELLIVIFRELEEKLIEYSMGKITKEEKNIEKRIYVGIRSVLFFYDEYKDLLSILKSAMVVEKAFEEIGANIQKILLDKAVRDYEWSLKNGLCRDIDPKVATMCIVNIIQGAGEDIILNNYNDEELEALSLNITKVCYYAIFKEKEIII